MLANRLAACRSFVRIALQQRSISRTSPMWQDKQMNDPMEHATGIEKRELLAKAGGCDDPFGINILKRGAGTKECPTLIPSAFEGRMVGCVCNEEQRYVCWMWLEKGCPKRCECGHWFKLYPTKAL